MLLVKGGLLFFCVVMLLVFMVGVGFEGMSKLYFRKLVLSN